MVGWFFDPQKIRTEYAYMTTPSPGVVFRNSQRYVNAKDGPVRRLGIWVGGR
jgi:hypothetical protein